MEGSSGSTSASDVVSLSASVRDISRTSEGSLGKRKDLLRRTVEHIAFILQTSEPEIHRYEPHPLVSACLIEAKMSLTGLESVIRRVSSIKLMKNSRSRSEVKRVLLHVQHSVGFLLSTIAMVKSEKIGTAVGNLAAAVGFENLDLVDLTEGDKLCIEGHKYYFGHGVVKDLQRAFNIYLASANAKNIEACCCVGQMYMNGEGVHKDSEKGRRWLEQAADGGNVDAMNQLGMMWEDGADGISRDSSKAFECYRKGAEKGHVDAITNLGFMYEMGLGVGMNESKAVELYRRSAGKGYPKAQNNLGVLYFDGRGVDQDYKEAVKWFQISGESGFGPALSNLGICYESGKGVTSKDIQKAGKYYLEASTSGNANAISNLAYLKLIQSEYEEARTLLRDASESGCIDAHYHLGCIWDYGLGVPQDAERAFFHYLKASENKNCNARVELRLGDMFFEGLGVPEDKNKAHEYYSCAAEKGDDRAENCLGIMCEEGFGTEKNLDGAITWYTRSAEKGNGDAMLNLGLLFRFGKGTDQDFDEARRYFELAMKSGNKEGHVRLKELDSKQTSTKTE